MPEEKRSGQPRRLDDNQVGGDHYSKMEITPWEALQAWLTPEEFRGYLKGEAIVYIARELAKAGPVDIGKARHVLQKLEEVYPAGAKVEPEHPPESPVCLRTPMGRCIHLSDFNGVCKQRGGCTCAPPAAASPATPPKQPG